MTEYKIVFDNTAFTGVVQRQTEWLKDNLLFETSLYDYANDKRNAGSFWTILKGDLKRAPQHKADRAIFLAELLVYLGEKREIIRIEFEDDAATHILLDDVTHYLVRELEKVQAGLDKNAFTLEEIKQVRTKVNTILKKLDKLALGQEVIFNRVEELKEDYKDILNSFGLGKKPFYQRFAGIMATYLGEKGADELFRQLGPLLKDVAEQSVKLIT